MLGVFRVKVKPPVKTGSGGEAKPQPINNQGIADEHAWTRRKNHRKEH
jgi:hypothetical protein